MTTNWISVINALRTPFILIGSDDRIIHCNEALLAEYTNYPAAAKLLQLGAPFLAALTNVVEAGPA